MIKRQSLIVTVLNILTHLWRGKKGQKSVEHTSSSGWYHSFGLQVKKTHFCSWGILCSSTSTQLVKLFPQFVYKSTMGSIISIPTQIHMRITVVKVLFQLTEENQTKQEDKKYKLTRRRWDLFPLPSFSHQMEINKEQR